MELESFIQTHILGGVYGQALGDAWAMPAYVRPSQNWAHFGWLDTFMPAPADHPTHAGLQAGQITSASQQAMTLAQAIITQGQITVEGAAQAIVAWYDEIDGENAPQVDPSTQRAVSALKSGADPHHTGEQGHSNSGATWISPIGFIHPGNAEAAVVDTVIACTPTHYTDLAISGACAVAAAVAQAFTPDITLEDIIDVAVRAAELGRQRGIIWMGASVARKIEYAVQLATDVNLSEHDRLQNLYDLVGSTPSPADSVPCAFGVLALANGNPVETAIFAAALAGDANSVGAMACAIAGAWQGIGAIPTDYIDILRRANPGYDFEATAAALTQIAQKNYAASVQAEDNGLNIPLDFEDQT
jgi:ADP-ribosylglycohydrolase